MTPPYRIEWLDEAKADIRRLDRETAMRIFAGVLHYVRTGGGDVAALHGEFAGRLRLRIGDYRVLFTSTESSMLIAAVRHRRQAYR